jgi:ABC-type hemin transport system substrate-binding protein
MFMALVVAACHEEDAVKTLADSSNSAPRIASFSPALSATVVALGWENALVGRTPWCASTAPIVGSLNDVDLETLMRTKPNLILIQQTQVGAPPQLEQAARAKNWRLEFIPATSLDDIRHLPGAVEKAVGQPAPIRAQLLVDALEKELSPCAAAQKLSPAILLYSDEPIGAFGADTYLAQAWVAMGGTLALPNKGNPNLSLEELFATQPKSIIVIVGSVGDKDHARPPNVLDDACPKRGVSHLELYAPKLLLPGPELATGLKLFRAEIEKFCQPMTPMSSPNLSSEQMNGAADKP